MSNLIHDLFLFFIWPTFSKFRTKNFKRNSEFFVVLWPGSKKREIIATINIRCRRVGSYLNLKFKVQTLKFYWKIWAKFPCSPLGNLKFLLELLCGRTLKLCMVIIRVINKWKNRSMNSFRYKANNHFRSYRGCKLNRTVWRIMNRWK